jgi:diacylglycerol kinase
MIGKLLRSVANALNGLAHALRTELILQMDGVIAVCVIAAGFFFALSAAEWIAVSLCIGMVISAECANTAIERLADRVSLEEHPLIKQAKECSAAAVLVLASTSGVIGCIIFVPKVRAWMGW